MVKKEGTHLVVVRERDLMGTLAIFRRVCVAALHPRTAFLVLSQSGLCRWGPRFVSTAIFRRV